MGKNCDEKIEFFLRKKHLTVLISCKLKYCPKRLSVCFFSDSIYFINNSLLRYHIQYNQILFY